MLTKTMNRYPGLLRAVLTLGVGISLLFLPELTLLTLVQLVGILFLIKAVTEGITAFQNFNDFWGRGHGIQFIVDLFIALILLIHPDATIGLFVVLIALWGIIVGVSMAFSYNRLKRAGVTDLRLFLQTIIVLLFSFVLLLEPLHSGFTMASLFGLFFVIWGVMDLWTVFRS